MKGTRHLARAGILGLFLLFSASARALPPFSEYGPACQWLRLNGQIHRPSGMGKEEPVLLTITYRLSGQSRPYTLMTNRPVPDENFLFVLSGFEEKIAGALFVEPGFFFAKKIEFQYFAASLDRKWKSPWQRSVYLPLLDKQEGKVYCRTAVALEPLELEAR